MEFEILDMENFLNDDGEEDDDDDDDDKPENNDSAANVKEEAPPPPDLDDVAHYLSEVEMLLTHRRRPIKRTKSAAAGGGKVLPADGDDDSDDDGQSANDDRHHDFCKVCHAAGDLLCCDTCPEVFHMHCVTPPMLTAPTGSWSCDACLEGRVEDDDAAADAKFECSALPGGEWSATLDGGDPEEDDGALIRTAIRYVKKDTGIDLSQCSQWSKSLCRGALLAG